MKVKLVKTGERKFRHLTLRKYDVVVESVKIGSVEADAMLYGPQGGFVTFWQQNDAKGQAVGALGWSEYRKDAVDAVVMASGVTADPRWMGN